MAYFYLNENHTDNIKDLQEALTIVAHADYGRDDDEMNEFQDAAIEILSKNGSCNKFPVALACLGRFYKKPSDGFDALLTHHFSTKVQKISMYSEWDDVSEIPLTEWKSGVFGVQTSGIKLCKDPKSLLRMLYSIYEAKGEDVPSPYKKIFHEEMTTKYLKKSLMGMPEKTTEVSERIAEMAVREWPFLVGMPGYPASDNIERAVLIHAETDTEVLVIDKHARIITFRVPKSEAKSHQQVMALCDKELARVNAGGTPRLERSTHDFSVFFLEKNALNDHITRHTERVIAEVSMIKHSMNEIGNNTRFMEIKSGLILKALHNKIRGANASILSVIPEETKDLAKSFEVHNKEVLSFLRGSPNGEADSGWETKKSDAEDSFFYVGALFSVAKKQEFRDCVVERRPVLPVLRGITGLTKSQIDALIRMPTPKKRDQIIADYPPFDPGMTRQIGLEGYVKACRMYRVLASADEASPREKIASAAMRFYLELSPSSGFWQSRHKIEDYKDYIAEIDKSLINQICTELHGEPNEITAKFLKTHLYPKRPTELVRMSQEYHDRIGDLQRNYAAKRNRYLTNWDPLTEEFLFDKRISVKELTSTQSIVQQGNVQRHCVGGYAEDVLDGHILILSVEDKSGVLSTVELGRQTLENLQHRGLFNCEPSDDEKNAVSSFISFNSQLISHESHVRYLNGLKEAKAKAIRFTGDHSRNAFDLMRTVLPKKTVDAGYDSLIESAIKNYENLSATQEGLVHEIWTENEDNPNDHNQELVIF